MHTGLHHLCTFVVCTPAGTFEPIDDAFKITMTEALREYQHLQLSSSNVSMHRLCSRQQQGVARLCSSACCIPCHVSAVLTGSLQLKQLQCVQ
jgi:hypothetical protein